MGGAGKTRTFPRAQEALCVRNSRQIFVRDLADTPLSWKEAGWSENREPVPGRGNK